MNSNYENIKKQLDDLSIEISKENYKNYNKNIAAFSEYYEIHKKYNEVLKKYAWPPFARTYTSDMKDIITISEKNDNYEQTKKDINEYFVHRLKCNNFEYLDYLVNSWLTVEKLQNRISIIKDIIAVHKAGYYSLSVPMFIIQIEGIIAEINNYKGKINYEINKIFFKNLFSLKGKVNSDNPANYFILKKLYEGFDWGDGKEHELSRHAIIHGEDTKYSTEINSTKIIHLIDYIIYVAYILEKES